MWIVLSPETQNIYMMIVEIRGVLHVDESKEKVRTAERVQLAHLR